MSQLLLIFLVIQVHGSEEASVGHLDWGWAKQWAWPRQERVDRHHQSGFRSLRSELAGMARLPQDEMILRQLRSAAHEDDTLEAEKNTGIPGKRNFLDHRMMKSDLASLTRRPQDDMILRQLRSAAHEDDTLEAENNSGIPAKRDFQDHRMMKSDLASLTRLPQDDMILRQLRSAAHEDYTLEAENNSGILAKRDFLDLRMMKSDLASLTRRPQDDMILRQLRSTESVLPESDDAARAQNEDDSDAAKRDDWMTEESFLKQREVRRFNSLLVAQRESLPEIWKRLWSETVLTLVRPTSDLHSNRFTRIRRVGPLAAQQVSRFLMADPSAALRLTRILRADPHSASAFREDIFN